MRRAFVALIMGGNLAMSCFAENAASAQSSSDRSFEFRQKQAEAHRKFEQHRAEFERNFQHHQFGNSNNNGVTTYGGTPAASSRTVNYSKSPSNFSSSSNSAFASHSTPNSSTSQASPGENFDSRTAPSPGQCFMSLVQNARSAARVDSLFSYLPSTQVKVLKERQALHDPALAAKRRADYQAAGTLDRDAIEHLTQDPYSGELKSLKNIANKVIKVRSSEIKGNKAVISVLTHSDAKARFNGGKWEAFPYSTARIDMVGEGSYWKFDRYNDNNINYKTPPP